MDAATKAERLRRNLVRGLERDGVVTTPSVRNAFLSVAREVFVPEITDIAKVYSDQALPTKSDSRGAPVSSSSQPRIMACMLEELALEPGHRVLEVGAGTGYNAALVKSIVGRGSVVTVDIDPDLVRRARSAVRRSGHAVVVREGDGREGFAPHAPYDRIVVTASSEDVPRAWFEQLRPGGRLVLPLRLSTSTFGPQIVVTLRKDGDRLRSASILSGAFMTLRPAAGADARDFPRMALQLHLDGKDEHRSVAGDALAKLSRADGRRILGLLAASPRRRLVFRGSAARAGGLAVFAALALPPSRLIEAFGRWWATGVVAHGADGVALLVPTGQVWGAPSSPASVALEAFGTTGAETEVARVVEEWRALGRPGWTDLRIEVSYGRDGAGAWRTSRRTGSVLHFDWAARAARPVG